jgi:hypothetical protein
MTENICITFPLLYTTTDDESSDFDTTSTVRSNNTNKDNQDTVTRIWMSLLDTNNIVCDVYLVSIYEILYFPHVRSIHIGSTTHIQHNIQNKIKLSIDRSRFVDEHELAFGSCHIPINNDLFQSNTDLIMLYNGTKRQLPSHQVRYDVPINIVPDQIPIVRLHVDNMTRTSTGSCARHYDSHLGVTVKLQEAKDRFFDYMENVQSSSVFDIDNRIGFQNQSNNDSSSSNQNKSDMIGTVFDSTNAVNSSSNHGQCTLSFHQKLVRFKHKTVRNIQLVKVTRNIESNNDPFVGGEKVYQNTEKANDSLSDYNDVDKSAYNDFVNVLQSLYGMTAAQRILERLQTSRTSKLIPHTTLHQQQLNGDVILQDLQSIVQREIQDLDRILIAMGISASILIIALVWTFLQIRKSDRNIGVKSISSSGSIHKTGHEKNQTLLVPVEIQWNDKRKQQQYYLPKPSPCKSVSSIPSLSSIPFQYKNEYETSSVCSRQQQEWLEKQRHKTRHRKQIENMEHIDINQNVLTTEFKYNDFVHGAIEDRNSILFKSNKSYDYEDNASLPLDIQWNDRVKQQQQPYHRKPSPCKSISSIPSMTSLPIHGNIENEPLSPCSRQQLEWLKKQRAKKHKLKQTRISEPLQIIKNVSMVQSNHNDIIDAYKNEIFTTKESTHKNTSLYVVAEEKASKSGQINKKKSFSEQLLEQKQTVQRKSEDKVCCDVNVQNDLSNTGPKQVNNINKNHQKYDVTSYFKENW